MNEVISIKLSDCERALIGFSNLSRLNFKASFAYRISKITKKLNAINKEIDEAREKLLEKHLITPELLADVAFQQTQTFKDCQKEYDEFLETEELIHGVEKIKIEEFGEQNIVPEIFDLIEPFIAE